MLHNNPVSLQSLFCPLSQRIMLYPVVLNQTFTHDGTMYFGGTTYECEEIQKKLKLNNTGIQMIENKTLKSLIEAFLLSDPLLWGHVYQSNDLRKFLLHLLGVLKDASDLSSVSDYHQFENILNKNTGELLLSILKQDHRYLKEETILYYQKNLFTLACEYAPLNIVKIVMEQIQNSPYQKLNEYKNIKEDDNGRASLVILLGQRFGVEATKLMVDVLGYDHFLATAKRYKECGNNDGLDILISQLNALADFYWDNNQYTEARLL